MSTTPKKHLIVYWARRDFRLHDNPALTNALADSSKTGAPLVPLFILEDYMCRGDAADNFGLPQRLFLTRAVPMFAQAFAYFCIGRGVTEKLFENLLKHYTLSVHVNEDVHPYFYKHVSRLRELVKDGTLTLNVHTDMLTVSKLTKTGTGGIYSVFTPFKNAVWESFVTTDVTPKASLHELHAPSPEVQTTMDRVFRAIPHSAHAMRKEISHEQTFLAGKHEISIATLLPEHTYAQAEKMVDDWYASETEAVAHFDSFLEQGNLENYREARDSLARDAEANGIRSSGVTRLSLALAWGLLSSRMLVQKIQHHYAHDFKVATGQKKFTGPVHFISELIWREFYKYLLYHRPELLTTEFQEKYRGTIHWVTDHEALRRFSAWIQGKTGYPLVDAAMMQLAQTGFMHNRTRMVVASVLTKNLGVDWRWGQEYFRATLIDLDEASNNGGWQWGASVGADPKPIRIFNPLLQAETHDPHGTYQKKWLSKNYLENPPKEIVPHRDARHETLTRYHLTKSMHGIITK